MKSLIQLCLASTLITASPAAVTLTFSTTAEGFAPIPGNAGNGSSAWSANYGGSLAITILNSGWTNPVSMLNLTSTPALQTEYNNALLYGGSLTFDYIVSQADIIGYSAVTPPGWFELVVTANSDGSKGGGYDQNILGGALGYGGPIPTGPTTKPIALGVAAGAPANNTTLTFGIGSGWNELMIGLNSQQWANDPTNTIRTFTSATVYIDNLRLSANPAPEPATGALALFATGALMRRRRPGT